MKKKILFLIIGVLLIVAIIIAVCFIKNEGTPVEEFMKDEDWKVKQENLKSASKHNWKISKTGIVECTHCKKSYEIGSTINYIPEDDGEKIKLSKDLTGHSEVQVVTREDATWVVLGTTEDGKGLLITTDKPLNQKDSIIFKGAQVYNNGVEALDTIARVLYSNNKYGFARSMSLEDVSKYLGFENKTTQYSYQKPVDVNDENYNEKQVSTEEWAVIENLTTKVKNSELFEDIIKNGTYTPDGQNTKEALGEYYLNGYALQTSGKVENGKCIIRVFGSDNIFEVEAEKQDFIFGVHEDNLYSYWLASKGVTLSKDFVAFGIGIVENGSASSCVEMYDSRGETGLYYTADLKPGIRPVVELYVVD